MRYDDIGRRLFDYTPLWLSALAAVCVLHRSHFDCFANHTLISNNDSLESKIEKQGGRCVRQDGKIVEIYLEGGMIDDDIARQLASHSTITDLTLVRCGVRDEHLDEIAKLKQLQRLNLASNLFGDQGIESLATTARKLRVLNLSHTSLTDKSGKVLASLPCLQNLSVADTVITDRFVQDISANGDLREFDISNSKVTSKALGELSRGKCKLASLEIKGCVLGAFPDLQQSHSLSELKTLDLSCSEISGGSEKSATTFRELRELRCINGSIPKQLLIGFADARKFRVIDSSSCRAVDDEVVIIWAKCNNLVSIDLSHCRLTDASLLSFKNHSNLQKIAFGHIPPRIPKAAAFPYTLKGIDVLLQCKKINEVAIVTPSAVPDWLFDLASDRPSLISLRIQDR